MGAVTTLVELAGFVCLAIGAFLFVAALGFVVVGAELLILGWQLAPRQVPRVDGPRVQVLR